MATFTTITDAALEPGKPIRSVDGLALRDNPIAIAEGDATAPRIQNAALDDDIIDDRTLGGAATTVGRDWVLTRTALAAVGAVGTYALLQRSDPGGIDDLPGDTRSGSDLRYSSSAGSSVGTTVSGTWRCMGFAERTGQPDTNRTTVWLRIV